MHSTLKSGLDCKACTTHKPLQVVRGQFGVNRDHFNATQSNLALKVNGIFVCCKCGAQLGTDDDHEMPEMVAEILRTLVQECLFAVEQVVDEGDGNPVIRLIHKADSGIRCYVAWLRHPKFQGLYEPPLQLNGQEFDPSELKVRTAPLVEHTIRVLMVRKVVLTEMPKADCGYAHLGAIQHTYESRLGDRQLHRRPSEWEPVTSTPRENISAPVLIKVQLTWPKSPDFAARMAAGK